MRAQLATGLVLGLFACGPSSDDGSGGGGPDAGGGGGGGPVSCDNAADCSGVEVCDPDERVCVGGLGCATSAECGAGGICDAGSCRPNETGGACEGDANCLTGETCQSGHCGCLGVAYQAMPVTPNVMIVLDRSDSMNDGGGGGTKWNIARDTLRALLDQFGGQVRFGLNMFASDNVCAAGTIRVGVGDSTATQIKNVIGSTNAASSTPIKATMQQLLNYNGLEDPDHPNYVLLLTDGMETCACGLFSCDDPSVPVGALRNKTPSVRTFVVGFGSGVDHGQLNDIAVKGGTALPGTTKYYQANDATQLADALEAIIGSVLSCSYTLDQVPEDLAELYVYENGDPIDRDPTHSDGWDYDEATGTLTFYGPACEALQSGQVSDLDIVYGCPGVDVE